MSDHEVVVGKAAEREIRKLPKAAQRVVVKALEKLAGTPRPPGAEKLSGRPAFYRLRAGDYRIIYAIRAERLVIVLVVRDRKEAYRGLEDLDGKLAQAMVDKVAALLRQKPPGGNT